MNGQRLTGRHAGPVRISGWQVAVALATACLVAFLAGMAWGAPW